MKNIIVIGALFLLSGCGNSSSKIIPEKSGEKKVEPPQERYNNPLDPYDASLVLRQPLEEFPRKIPLYYKGMDSQDLSTVVDFSQKLMGDWIGSDWGSSPNVRIYWRFESGGECCAACIQRTSPTNTQEHYSRIFGTFSEKNGFLLIRLSAKTTENDLKEFLSSCGAAWEKEKHNATDDWMLEIPIGFHDNDKTLVMAVSILVAEKKYDFHQILLFKKEKR